MAKLIKVLSKVLVCGVAAGLVVETFRHITQPALPEANKPHIETNEQGEAQKLSEFMAGYDLTQSPIVRLSVSRRRT